MITAQEFFIQRNTEIIRQWLALREKKVKAREALKQVAENVSLSYETIAAIIYKPSYSYSAEAWEIVKNEQKEQGVKVNLS